MKPTDNSTIQKSGGLIARLSPLFNANPDLDGLSCRKWRIHWEFVVSAAGRDVGREGRQCRSSGRNRPSSPLASPGPPLFNIHPNAVAGLQCRTCNQI
jgi:hypothetical protein